MPLGEERGGALGSGHGAGALLLFEQTLADPRGCVPRELRIERTDGRMVEALISMAPVRPDDVPPTVRLLVPMATTAFAFVMSSRGAALRTTTSVSEAYVL